HRLRTLPRSSLSGSLLSRPARWERRECTTSAGNGGDRRRARASRPGPGGPAACWRSAEGVLVRGGAVDGRERHLEEAEVHGELPAMVIDVVHHQTPDHLVAGTLDRSTSIDLHLPGLLEPPLAPLFEALGGLIDTVL